MGNDAYLDTRLALLRRSPGIPPRESPLPCDLVRERPLGHTAGLPNLPVGKGANGTHNQPDLQHRDKVLVHAAGIFSRSKGRNGHSPEIKNTGTAVITLRTLVAEQELGSGMIKPLATILSRESMHQRILDRGGIPAQDTATGKKEARDDAP